MRRAVGVAICLGLLASYALFLSRVFESPSVRPSSTDSLSLSKTPKSIFGNGKLQALVLLEDGSAELVDGQNGIQVNRLETAAPFQSGMLSAKGEAYLMDDRKVLYRWMPGKKVAKSRPIKIEGDVLSIAVEENPHVLWCIARRQKPEPESLMVYAISLENGKQIGSVNLEAHRGQISLVASQNGNGIIVATTDSPGAFYFKYVDKALISKFLDAKDLVDSSAFDGSEVLLGLRTGNVQRFEPATGVLLRTYTTDFLPVTQLVISGSEIAVAHGDGDGANGTGSAYLVDSKSGAVLLRQGTRDRTLTVAGSNGHFGYLFGSRDGTLQLLKRGKGALRVDVPAKYVLGSTGWMTGSEGTFLLIGSRKIEKLDFE